MFLKPGQISFGTITNTQILKLTLTAPGCFYQKNKK